MSEKIKLKMGVIVAEPIHGMHEGQPVLIDYKFTRALDKLTRDPLPIREKHAAAKTLKEVRAFIQLYQDGLKELLEKHGYKRSQALKELVVSYEKDLHDALLCSETGKVLTAMNNNITRIKKEIGELESKPSLDTVSIEPSDTAATAAFQAGDAALREQEVELIYLNHKIKLSKDSKLDGDETVAIEELIELPEE